MSYDIFRDNAILGFPHGKCPPPGVIACAGKTIIPPAQLAGTAHFARRHPSEIRTLMEDLLEAPKNEPKPEAASPPL